MKKNIPPPLAGGDRGEGYLLTITLSPTLSRPRLCHNVIAKESND